MSAFPDIDTSRLPPLDIVVDMGFDGILADMLEKFAADNPEYAASLDFESEPNAQFAPGCRLRHLLRGQILGGRSKGDGVHPRCRQDREHFCP